MQLADAVEQTRDGIRVVDVAGAAQEAMDGLLAEASHVIGSSGFQQLGDGVDDLVGAGAPLVRLGPPGHRDDDGHEVLAERSVLGGGARAAMDQPAGVEPQIDLVGRLAGARGRSPPLLRRIRRAP